MYCFNSSTIGAQSVKVVSMVSARGEWDWSQFQHLIPQHILLHIAVIRCPAAALQGDLPVWAADRSGRFSVKSAYWVWNRVEEGPEEDVWSLIARFQGTQ
ncbi:hypothetical protein V6N13_092946 [Hibiscus sabdariffa]